MKIFVYEISGIRNLQYDIDKLTQVLKFSFVIKKIKNIKKIDLVDTKKDIQDFIKENKSDRVNSFFSSNDF